MLFLKVCAIFKKYLATRFWSNKHKPLSMINFKNYNYLTKKIH